jgi:hypothetical protein
MQCCHCHYLGSAGPPCGIQKIEETMKIPWVRGEDMVRGLSGGITARELGREDCDLQTMITKHSAS